ncbi:MULTISPECIES: GumC family protein [Bacteroides]|uniref:GumC family protein n=1 Tax=Bacteroides TaxID=816 RepID=UPI000B374778|nr:MULTISPECIES: polysaccharide biosynthesis tyrosine autokinase [Bacteroides]MBM6944681.1 polysaccharide biosynthesis tyrosine autokinase [Bacteroides gallinaceum]OUO61372.1 tyrosine protein kinase [Bacteroides sp. An279]
MKENIYSDFYQEEGKRVDYKAIFFEYLLYWPVIVGVLVCFIVGAYIYLRYCEPVYSVSSTVLIKQADHSKSGSSAFASSIQDFGSFSVANDFENELEILQSYTLIKKVVTTLGLYIDYAEDGGFGYDPVMYQTSPIQVWMAPEEADRLPSALQIQMECLPQGKVNAALHYQIGKETCSLEKSFDKLPAVFITPVGTLNLSWRTDSVSKRLNSPLFLSATIESPSVAADKYKMHLTAEPVGDFTSIVKLTCEDVSVRRGVDFLRMLVTQYNNEANEDKNQVATRTAQFIDERIRIINAELGSTESELAEYKQRAGLTDLSADAQLALQESSEYDKQRAENTNQLRLIAFLRSYIDDPKNRYEVIPANVGLADGALVNVIAQYNELLVERKRLLRSSNENNPMLINLDASIAVTRNTVLTTVENVEKGLQITRNSLDLQAGKYQSRINRAPQQERELISITRQQEIKANLYLMLLQKREENAITLAATANNGRIIEEPRRSGLVAPNTLNIYFVALVLGLFFPIMGIYLVRLLRFKIESRVDVERITNVSVIGDVPLVDNVKTDSVVIKENENGLMEEVFRNVRTNIQYMLQEGQKVILFTSTVQGEGKSFNAANLAVSFAFMDRRTVVVGMDIRKPKLNHIFGLSGKLPGMTQFLASPSSVDLLSLCQPTAVSPNLYVLPSGAVPPNPTELVARKSLEQAIDLLKQHFDYVILDTAPIGMVTDTRLIARVADLSVYVCRAGYTHKNDFELINELEQEKKLPNLCVLINGIDMSKRKNGYYYSYGKYSKYGYGKKYGYGYGYGNEK